MQEFLRPTEDIRNNAELAGNRFGKQCRPKGKEQGRRGGGESGCKKKEKREKRCSFVKPWNTLFCVVPLGVKMHLTSDGISQRQSLSGMLSKVRMKTVEQWTCPCSAPFLHLEMGLYFEMAGRQTSFGKKEQNPLLFSPQNREYTWKKKQEKNKSKTIPSLSSVSRERWNPTPPIVGVTQVVQMRNGNSGNLPRRKRTTRVQSRKN